jgi:Ulp1 family protease
MDKAIETPAKVDICFTVQCKSRDDGENEVIVVTQLDDDSLRREIGSNAEKAAESYLQKRRRLALKCEELTRSGLSSRIYMIPYRKDDPNYDSRSLLSSQYRACITNKSYSELMGNPSSWLNDEMIMIFALHIARLNEHTLVLMDLFEGKHIRQTSRPLRYFRCLLDDTLPIRLLFAPLHCNGNHWTLFVVDKLFHEIHFYDSMSCSRQSCARQDGEPESSVFRTYLPAWENLLREADCANPWAIREDSCPHQGNGYDCGVYVCYFMAELARISDPIVSVKSLHGYFEHRPRINTVAFRASIASVLEQYYTGDETRMRSSTT